MSYLRPRSDWTSTGEGWRRGALDPARVKGVVIHYPGDGNVTRRGASVETVRGLLRSYRAWHLRGRGWSDIGYNIAISPHGIAWWAAGKRIAAHAATPSYKTANSDYIGILLVIGNNEAPTQDMITAINNVLSELKTLYPNIREVIGHRQVRGASTACPGNPVSRLIADGTIGLGKKAPSKPAPSTAPKPSGKSWPNAALPVTKAHTTASHNAWVRLMASIGLRGPKLGRNLQRWLRGLGYYTRAIDGYFGGHSVIALQCFLARKGLYRGRIDGHRGPITIAAEIAYLNAQRHYLT